MYLSYLDSLLHLTRITQTFEPVYFCTMVDNVDCDQTGAVVLLKMVINKYGLVGYIVKQEALKGLA